MYKSFASRARLVAAAIAASLVLTSCPSTGLNPIVNTDDISATVEHVVTTHDGYLGDLTDLEADTYRAESLALLELVTDYESLPPAAFSFAADPVMARHDTWVVSDTALTPLERRIYLRDTNVLRQYIGALTDY
jgi:hypothetical protein